MNSGHVDDNNENHDNNNSNNNVISVNGDPREVPEGCTLEGLLGLLDLHGRRVAVAINRGIVPRARYAASVLAEKHCLPKMYLGLGAVTVAASESLFCDALPVAPDKSNGDEVSRGSYLWVLPEPVFKESKQRCIGVDQGDVLPAVEIEVYQRPRSSVGRIIQPGDSRDVLIAAATTIHEEMVSLVPTVGEGVGLLEREEPTNRVQRVHSQVGIGAHDRAPEKASHVDLAFDLFWCRVIATQRIDV